MPLRPASASSHLLPALRSHVWFASCPLALQQALVDCAKVVNLKPGERLFFFF